MIDSEAEFRTLGVADQKARCDQARALVAANPDDEGAAERLFDAVTEMTRELAPTDMRNARTVAPAVTEAARLLESGAAEEAEILLRRYLAAVRNDPDAMLLMAKIAARCGFVDKAENILRRSVEIHPSRTDNWVALAKVLHGRAAESDQAALVDDALDALQRALAIDPNHEEALDFKTNLLLQTRRLDEALKTFEHLLQLFESSSRWLNYGYLLKTLGRFGEAVAAYRTAVALDPVNGTVWWSLADLKLARFFPADIPRMAAAIEQAGSETSRVGLHFALAAAYDQAKDYEFAAQHLREGSTLRHKLRPYNIDDVDRVIDAAVRAYTPAFFALRADAGEASPDPIFVLGMPRSGSTLLEQILASHTCIEGTEELFAVHQTVSELVRHHETELVDETISQLPGTEFQKLGRRYLEITRLNRKTDRPRFTDKNPDNWRHVGLIRAMLPNAKIIDIRRHPLDCCFANYAQHFLAGADYSYGFKELASRYRHYVRLMRHLDAVVPGAVHRVIYEDLVENTEPEVRRLFDYLGLPFEERCLRFFETDRPIHTPSSEQVRQPINRAGLGKWMRYEPWIGELKEELADLLGDWRR